MGSKLSLRTLLGLVFLAYSKGYVKDFQNSQLNLCLFYGTPTVLPPFARGKIDTTFDKSSLNAPSPQTMLGPGHILSPTNPTLLWEGEGEGMAVQILCYWRGRGEGRDVQTILSTVVSISAGTVARKNQHEQLGQDA